MVKNYVPIAFLKGGKSLSKEEYVNLINQNGYRATLESGVIILSLDNEKHVKKAFKDVRSMGYNASIGARIKRGDSDA